jgi:hypothetical protein
MIVFLSISLYVVFTSFCFFSNSSAADLPPSNPSLFVPFAFFCVHCVTVVISITLSFTFTYSSPLVDPPMVVLLLPSLGAAPVAHPDIKKKHHKHRYLILNLVVRLYFVFKIQTSLCW